MLSLKFRRVIKQVVVLFAALVGALLVGALFLLLAKSDPIKAYGNKGTEALAGVSLTKMKLWNIGAEGQLYMGAMGASWLPLTFPTLPVYFMIPGMVILGMTAGGLWALLTAIPRAIWKVNEIITTLMLNYVVRCQDLWRRYPPAILGLACWPRCWQAEHWLSSMPF